MNSNYNKNEVIEKATKITKEKTDWNKVKEEHKEEAIEKFFKEQLSSARLQGMAIGIQAVSSVIEEIANKEISDEEKLVEIKTYIKTNMDFKNL